MYDTLRLLYKRVAKKPLKVRITPTEVSERGSAAASGRGSELTPIPPLIGESIVEQACYPIRAPFSYARIYYDRNDMEQVYEVLEPPLTVREKAMLELIKDTLQRTMSYEWGAIASSGGDKASYIKGVIKSYIETRNVHLDDISYRKIEYYIVRDFVEYERIQALMEDELVEDVSCDGHNVYLYVYHKDFESVRTTVIFAEESDLDNFIVNLAQRCSKQISVSSPILDGTAVEGHRVQATYSDEVTTRGGTFTMRRYKPKPFTPIEVIKQGTANVEMIAYLWLAVQQGQSIMVCGGTASGKTATLNAIALFIPPGAKIITMEDTREINLPHENWIPGVTRTGAGDRGPDGKQAGEIDMFDLVKAALRQRPEYIIVGEVRGPETYTMFQAMATGHTTYSSMHADSVKSMVSRLENPPINTPRILLTALNLVIIQLHVRVKHLEVRRITKLVEIIGFDPETNELLTNTVYEWDQVSDSHIYKGHSFLRDKIMTVKNLTHEEMDLEFTSRTDIVQYMFDKGIDDYLAISVIVVEYYNDPEALLAKVNAEKNIAEEAARAELYSGLEEPG